jgi:hypothetical protein
LEPNDFISRSPISPAEEKLSLAKGLNEIRKLANEYFDDADEWYSRDEDLTDQIEIKVNEIERALNNLLYDLLTAINQSPFTSEVDHREVGFAWKGMHWALRFRKYEHREQWIEFDEDQFLAKHEATESYWQPASPSEAKRIFKECAESLNSRIGLVDTIQVGIPKPFKSGTSKTPKEEASLRRGIIRATEESNPGMKGKGLDEYTCIVLDRSNRRIPDDWRTDKIKTWEEAFKDKMLRNRIQKMFSKDRT